MRVQHPCEVLKGLHSYFLCRVYLCMSAAAKMEMRGADGAKMNAQKLCCSLCV